SVSPVPPPSLVNLTLPAPASNAYRRLGSWRSTFQTGCAVPTCAIPMSTRVLSALLTPAVPPRRMLVIFLSPVVWLARVIGWYRVGVATGPATRPRQKLGRPGP